MDDESQLTRLIPSKAADFDDVGIYRQMPVNHTPLPPSNRIARVDGTTLARLDAAGMAQRLRTAIDGSCTKAMPCTSGLVGIDDIAKEFRGAAGDRLASAMQQLQGQDAGRGGTDASRVVMYLDWDMLAELATPAKAGAWQGAASAVALGNSAWLEMYQSTGAGQMGTVSYRDWRVVPQAATDTLTAHGMQQSAIHFMVGPWAGTLPGQPASSCRDALTCVWKAATATPLNRSLVGNGVGMYRYGAAQLEGYCTFMWQADPGTTPDPAVRTDCRHWLAGQLDFIVPGSGDKLN